MADVPSAGELEARGLYDPSAADAARRLEMLQYLFANGAHIDQIAEVWASHEWHGLTTLAVELVARPGRSLTFDQAVERVGIDAERLAALWRAFGFPDPRDERRPFTETEVDMVADMLPLVEILGEGNMFDLARVVGSAMARIAEAGSTVFRLGFEVPNRESGMDIVDLVRQNVAFVEVLLPQAARLYEVLAARHIVANAYRAWDVDESMATTTSEVAIGFADLAGFTGHTQARASGEVAAVVTEFEQRVAHVIEGAGGRLVKLIGDEVMFVVDTPDRACALARHLVEAFDDDPALPPLRVGLTFGPVITMRGDYHGPVVNLAARLVTAAAPSTVLVSGPLHDAATDAAFEPVGPLVFKGFDDPVPAYRLLLP